jgi:hypothetical protein
MTKLNLKPTHDSDERLELDENAVCDACGRFGAYQFGDRLLCEDCYAGCGSCCLEFGKDDLWSFEEKA